MKTELELLAVRLECLGQDNSALSARLDASEAKNSRERRRLRIQAGLAFCGFVGAVILSPANRAAIAQGYGTTLASLNARVSSIETKTRYMSANTIAKSTIFSGCNVFVNDGGGTTDTVVVNSAGDGLGNLIIGYNALRGGGNDNRPGAHNLIVGDMNNYTAIGSLVAGLGNQVNGQYSSVIGGQNNQATGFLSSVSGGQNNSAFGTYSSIGGGAGNTANGPSSSISGGNQNLANGTYSSISGGGNNTATGDFSSVSGGRTNTAGQSAAVSGGSNITNNTFTGWSGGSLHSP